MSTSISQTPVKDSAKARSQDSHKTKKRKHGDEHGEPAAKKKKKHKKSWIEEDDHSLPEPEPSVKKHKKKHRSPPAPTGQLTPTSPSIVGAPASDSTPSIIEEDTPETQALTNEQTTLQHSPEPSIPDDTTPSPFHSVSLSLYLPLSAISLSPSTALSSLQAEHLAPLLLTYYAPARGIVLAFTDTFLSSTRPQPSSEPPEPPALSTSPTLAHCADDYGVSYTWLTTTFLVFRPTRTHTLPGWINVSSDGFVGLIAYNYFQAGVAKNRIPKDWRWIGPGGDPLQARKRNKPRKTIRIRSSDSDGDPMDIDMDADSTQTTQVAAAAAAAAAEDDYDGTGYFVDASGSRIKGTLPFRIVDVDVVPGHDRDKWMLQIEGTLLSPEHEAMLVEEERVQAEKLRARGKPSARGASRLATDAAFMSGALGAEERRRTASVSQTPVPSSARR